jgi:aspartate/methionine/tyrosine aminotransferase
MTFPERFADLPSYIFARLRALLDGHRSGAAPIDMTVGEPRHPFPDWVGEGVADSLADFGRYPPNEGTAELREAIAGWVGRRYGVTLDPARQIVPLNGTREGLFNAMLALSPRGATALIPNPFYQVYAAATLAVEGVAHYLPATAETGFLPDLDALAPDLLDRSEILWICSPSNPQGAVASRDYWTKLLALAERHDIRIFADECYSEVWRDAPPPGALEMAREVGADPERVVVFHSLSKRSNLPGLRSGFAAGGPESIARLKQLRAYSGAPLPLPIQHVSARLWADEAHVEASRALYAEKYRIAEEVLGDIAPVPAAGFFLWLPVEDGEAAALRLWQETGVRVLPGAYLSRDAAGGNPGRGYIRVAMVAEASEVRRGLEAIRACLYDGR